MTTFTPQQGDYFEVKDLTEEQCKKILDRENYTHGTRRYIGYTDGMYTTFDGLKGWLDVHYTEHCRLLTYQDVFSEDNKMINWSKPIETTDGLRAHVNEIFPNGDVLITYEDTPDRWVVAITDETCLYIRNKPELIKPQGWLVIYTERKAVDWYLDNPGTLRTHDKHVIVSIEDLMSGKFKDGIHKDYVSS